MVATLPPKRPDESSRRWIVASVGLAFAVAGLAISLLISGATSVSAANAGVAPPLVEQCNDSGALAGQELRCTIEVEQYLNANGTLASSPASTVTITICEGAASGGAVPCAASITTVLLEPVTTARQCNFAYHGGGSWIECTVTIANHWVGDPTPTPATIFQCVSSPVTGPGAPGTCDPLESENTAASTATATVGQCNDSGYGGTTPIDGFICTVHSSTTTAALPMHVDQCNDSGYGGGTVIRCTATVTNSVIAAPAPTPVPTAVPTAEPTAVPTAEPTAVPTAEPTAVPTAEPTAVPTAEPTAAPTVAPTLAVPAPEPAETGDAGLVGHTGTSSIVALLMSVTALGLLFAAGRFVSVRRDR